MALVQIVRSASQVRDEFESYGRYNQFSYEAYEVLFEYLWDLSEDIGEPIEFDVISICCDWTEYVDIHELAGHYSVAVADVIDVDEDTDEEDIEQALEEEMRNRGILLSVKPGVTVGRGRYLFSE